MKFLLGIVLLCELSSSSVLCQVLLNRYEGDSCRTDRGDQGTCKFVSDCPVVLEQIYSGKFPKVLCGFRGSQSIVCCPGALVTDSTTKRTTTTRTTTTTTTRTTTSTKRPDIASRTPGTISNIKCKEYSKYVFEKEESPTLSIFDTVSESNECPFDKETLIVGGTAAARREFPHMTQLGYRSGSDLNWGCGGSLISEYFVLTAGHCLEDRELGSPKMVRAGITILTDTSHLQQRDVQRVIKYPEYVNKKYHDIGLIRVKSKFDLDTYVRPACLHTETRLPFERAIASGWGKIEFAGDSSKELLKVVLEIFPIPKCNSTYRREILQPDSPLQDGIVEKIMVCAGSSEDFKDTCQGDSGGPLQIYRPDTEDIKCMYSIIGVTAFGKSCGLAKNVPGVYTRVSHYIEWIENTVWP